MKIGDKKVQRALKKQTARGLLQDNKVPGTIAGARATTAPCQVLPKDSWERVRLTAPSPANQGLSSMERDLVA